MLLRRVVFEATTLEDVFPPERKEESEIRPIYGARDLNSGVGRGGDASDNGGGARPVGRERRKLLNASVLDLMNAPRGRSGGADRHDEVDAVPEVVDVAAKAGKASVLWSGRVRRCASMVTLSERFWPEDPATGA